MQRIDGTSLREAVLRIHGKLMKVAATGKRVLLIAVGVSMLAAFDRGLEALLVQWSPDWLTVLTARY